MLAAALLPGVILPDAALAAPAPVTMAASTPWNLDATDSGCALRRGFGGKTPDVVMSLTRYEPGDGFELSINGDAFESVRPGETLSLEWTGTDAISPTKSVMPAVSTTPSGQKIAGFLASVQMYQTLKGSDDDSDGPLILAPEALPHVTAITLRWRNHAVTLKTGPMAKPFEAMRQCTDGLVESWGLDPAVQAHLSREVHMTNLRQIATKINYPSAMNDRGKQGRVNFRVLIDPDGKASNCKILRSYNDPKFDVAACHDILVLARFAPALDASGKPVASYYTTTIIYSI
ncbi:energy transducer TonB [Novosphingobium sp. 9]|uniref:energy transducer TonB n=1 Tax=Novosphingobium sp. 9 TaxID=2025349 RepID=UPI0021B54D7B|nr:energy transducer TonB [Novosphingobium sp. 9]